MAKRTFRRNHDTTPKHDELTEKRLLLNREKGIGDNPGRPILQTNEAAGLPKVYLVLGIIVIMLMTGLGWVYYQVRQFEKASGVPLIELTAIVTQGLHTSPFETRDLVTFLLLGLDDNNNQRANSLLTDTMMLITISRNGRITLISLPRDLWIESLKTKINALYYYGEESETTTGVSLVETIVGEITGLTVDGTFVVKMSNVVSLIDSLGGVEVEVPHSFVDTRFPRENVDITQVTDPALLYETVRFEAGTQLFDGLTALRYMRSRYSQDALEGTDVARVRRQQQVIEAIVQTLTRSKVLVSGEIMGKIFGLWRSMVTTNVAETDLAGLGWQLKSKPTTLITTSMPVTSEGGEGVIFNPPIQKHNLWVYEPVDPTWQGVRRWVAEQLGRLDELE